MLGVGDEAERSGVGKGAGELSCTGLWHRVGGLAAGKRVTPTRSRSSLECLSTHHASHSQVSTYGYPSTEWTTTYLSSLNVNGNNPGMAIKTGRYGAGAFPVMTMLVIVASAALLLQAVSLSRRMGRR